MAPTTKSESSRLLPAVACPNCWGTFKPEETLAIAEHGELIGDPLLGEGQQQRFLPTRFTVNGDPIDACGAACRYIACPRCHLRLPRALLEFPAVQISIVGNLDAGKSYYVTSMFWTLRRLFSSHFGLQLADADPELNQVLISNEERVFMRAAPDTEAVVGGPEMIEKTHAGFRDDLHYQTSRNGQRMEYVRPLMFTLSPRERHPKHQKTGRHSRIICTYDQSGEDFRPGRDTAARPLTRHVAYSHFTLFLYDPTQDSRFRKSVRGNKAAYAAVSRTRTLSRQETLVRELAVRYRSFRGIGEEARYQRPFVVVVTKADTWGHLLPNFATACYWRVKSGQQIAAVDLAAIESTSQDCVSCFRGRVPNSQRRSMPSQRSRSTCQCPLWESHRQ